MRDSDISALHIVDVQCGDILSITICFIKATCAPLCSRSTGCLLSWSSSCPPIGKSGANWTDMPIIKKQECYELNLIACHLLEKYNIACFVRNIYIFFFAHEKRLKSNHLMAVEVQGDFKAAMAFRYGKAMVSNLEAPCCLPCSRNERRDNATRNTHMRHSSRRCRHHHHHHAFPFSAGRASPKKREAKCFWTESQARCARRGGQRVRQRVRRRAEWRQSGGGAARRLPGPGRKQAGVSCLGDSA